MAKRIAFLTLGCKLNYAETSTYERGFKKNGLEVVSWNEKADVYLVNTCSVTAHSDAKCRNAIRKCHRVSPEAAIVVTGCYAELKREEVLGIDGVKLVFGAKEKSRVVPETMRLLGTDIEGADADNTIFGAYSTGERTRSFLKVQDGCNNFCAYCTVPYARGNSRNIPICEVIKHAEAIAAQGVKEVVLTGVNTGDFGRTTGESFLDLLKRLNEVEGIERYRISSIEPNLITEEIVDWIASGTKFQPHFHIPLQVGVDSLLKKVGRKYTTDFFADRIDYIRKKMDGRLKVFFGIDVIVGLPGETDELFRQTYDFLEKRVRPSFIHIFPYSKRPGTRAAVMPDQVSEEKKAERVKALEELSDRLNAEFVEAHRGCRAGVLFESSEKGGKMAGYTENYIRVVRPYDAAKVGKITEEII